MARGWQDNSGPRDPLSLIPAGRWRAAEGGRRCGTRSKAASGVERRRLGQSAKGRAAQYKERAATAVEAGDWLAGETGPVCGKANGEEEPSRTSRRREAAAEERGRTPDPRDLFPSFSAGTCSCNMTLEDLAGDHQAFGRYGMSSVCPLAVRGTAGRLQRRSVARWKFVGGGASSAEAAAGITPLALLCRPACNRDCHLTAGQGRRGRGAGQARCRSLKAIWEETVRGREICACVGIETRKGSVFVPSCVYVCEERAAWPFLTGHGNKANKFRQRSLQ